MNIENFEEKFLTEITQAATDFNLTPKTAMLGLLSIFGNTRHELSHSNTIYGLLRPNNFPKSQTYGDSFLALIGNATGKNIAEEHIITIEREKLTGNHRFIDINIVTENFDIIIENKIDAGDQMAQLTDYLLDAENTYPDKTVLVIYLTLTGYEPSEVSISRKEVEKLKEENRFGVLSYEKDIIGWLNELPAEGIIKSEIDVYIEALKEICGMNNKNEAINFGRQNFLHMKNLFIADPVKANICTEGLRYIKTTALYLEMLHSLYLDLKEGNAEGSIHYVLGQSALFSEYEPFEGAVLKTNEPYGLSVDIIGGYRIGLEFNPYPNLIDGKWYFGYMKGNKGTEAELKYPSNIDESNLTPDWEEEGWKIIPPSDWWGKSVEVSNLITQFLNSEQISDTAKRIASWFRNQINYLLEQ